jgi:hypothetical protein
MGITHQMKLLREYGRATEAGIITTRRSGIVKPGEDALAHNTPQSVSGCLLAMLSNTRSHYTN